MNNKGQDRKKLSQNSKQAPDIQKLLKAKPTKIPKVSRVEVAEPAAPRVDWKLFVIALSAVCLVAAAVFTYGLFGELVFNDGHTLREIIAARDLNAFWSTLFTQMVQHPASQQWLKATYAWDILSGGMSPVWFHMVNLGLHLTACIYLFLLIFRLSWRLDSQGRLGVNPYHLSFAATVLFACHPLTVESVTYLSGRAGTLGAVNYFAALNSFLFAYLAGKRSWRIWGYALAFVFSFVGITCSLSALTLPASMIALALLLRAPNERWADWWSKQKATVIALGAALVALPYLTLLGTGHQAGNWTGMPVPAVTEYVATQFKCFIYYFVRSALIPVGLSIDPPAASARSFADPWAALGALSVLATAFGLYYWRSKPVICLGIFMVLAGWSANLLAIQPELVSDRRYYLPLSGLCLLAGWFIAQLGGRSLKMGIAVLTAAVLLLSGLSIWREIDWHTDAALARATLSGNPESARAHALLALDYMRANKIGDAYEQAKDAVRLNPDMYVAHLALGNVYLLQKKYQAAQVELAKAIELASRHNLPRPIRADSALTMAEVLVQLNQPQEAISFAQEALDWYPDSERLHLILGKAYEATGSPAMALDELALVRKLNPNAAEVWEPIAKAALAVGMNGIAFQAAQNWVTFEPSVEADKILAHAAVASKNFKDAQAPLDRIFKDKPNDPQALALFSVVLEQTGMKEKALAERQKALDASPDIFSRLKLPPDVAPSLK